MLHNNTNLDWVEVNQDISKLSKKKEAGGHALSPWNGIWNSREKYRLVEFKNYVVMEVAAKIAGSYESN